MQHNNPETTSPPRDSVAVRPLINSGWLRALLYLIAVAVVTIAVEVILLLALRMVDEATNLESPRRALVSMVQFCVLIGLTWLFRKLVDNRSMVSLGFAFGRVFARNMLAGLMWGVLIMTAPLVVLALTGNLTPVAGPATAESLFFLAVTIFFASSSEEVICRGYLLNNLMSSMPRWLALVVASVVFSLLHSANENLSAIGLLNIFLAGMVLGVYYLYRRNLWFSIGIHVSWNFFQGGVYGIPVSGYQPHGLLSVGLDGPDYLTGGRFGLEGSVITTFVLVAVIGALFLIYRNGPAVPAVENRT